MKNKHSKSILSGDTIIRVPIILLLIAYASTKYEVSNIVESILIVCGMFFIIASVLKLYIVSIGYLNKKRLELSIIKIFFYLLSIIAISVSFFVFLSAEIMKFCFLSIAIILFLFLLIDIIIRVFKRLF